MTKRPTTSAKTRRRLGALALVVAWAAATAAGASPAEQRPAQSAGDPGLRGAALVLAQNDSQLETQGLTREGMSGAGLDESEYDQSDMNTQGIDTQGTTREGMSREGIDQSGFDQSDMDTQGLDSDNADN